ncbi:MAG: O-antigen ligase family protein [Candidatus Woesearchaeota archaeon]
MNKTKLYFLIFLCLQLTFLIILFTSHQPILVVGILFTLLTGLMIFIEPRLIFIFITFITFSIPHDIIGSIFVIPILGFNWYMMDWIMLFSFLAWFTRIASGNILKMQKSSLIIPICIFLVVLIVSVGVGVHNGYRLQDVLADFRLFFYYSSFFIVLIFVRNIKDIEIIFWSMIICGIIGALPEIFSSISKTSIDIFTGHKMFFTRITGPQEINYPLQLVASIVIFPFIKTVGKKILLIISSLTSLTALFLSYTRGSWLAAFAGLVLVVLIFGRFTFYKVKNFLKILSMILLPISIIIILNIIGIFNLNIFSERMGLVTSKQIDISSLERLTEWQVGWQVFLANPLLGAGLGYIYHFHAVGIGDLKQIFIHNSYLYVLSKMGLLGLTSIIFIYVKALISSIKAMSTLDQSIEMGLLLAFASMILVLLVKSLTTWHLNTLTTSEYIGVILGIVGVLPQLISTQLAKIKE